MTLALVDLPQKDIMRVIVRVRFVLCRASLLKHFAAHLNYVNAYP